MGLVCTISIWGYNLHSSYAQDSIFLSKYGFAPTKPVKKGDIGGVGGASRGECHYQTIMLEHGYTSTIQENPTFWVYIRNLQQENQQLAVQVNLRLTPLDAENENSSNISDIDKPTNFENIGINVFPEIVTKPYTLSENGLISLQIPSDKGLLVNKKYQWEIQILCGATHEDIAKIPKNTNIVGDFGVIHRIPDGGISNNLQGYLENGIWIDTINALIDLKSSPDHSTISNQETLLEEWENYIQNLEKKLSPSQ
ncbi:DUF928 domain-containing protein [[Leptolyngbya] sp. PCC 7376]|uniref:DUF928 domain-containing protein n=1 Tax=[Leptolyngbya] sp. PCC 7376 TaxID=111781 RepID=UPI0005A1537D|nr:DUF928 domain-containing protein [[Leptolyngbya] sp. PCC 7376]